MVRRRMVPSPTEAQRLVEDGMVEVRGIPTPKAASLVTPDTPITLKEDGPGYVGRGALKLEGALAVFPVLVAGRRVLDVGASTGGFTDLLLRLGAAEVVALDVGYGQLDQRLRDDNRVVVMERTNLRHTVPDDTDGRFDLVVGDLSFISLCTVAPALAGLVADDGDLVLLIKPQFEARKNEIGPGGIVRDDDVRQRTVEKVMECLSGQGMEPQGLTPSPIAGAGGNREVFVWARSGAPPVPDLEIPI